VRSEGNLGSRVVGEDSIFPLPENNWSGDKEARGKLPEGSLGTVPAASRKGSRGKLPEGSSGTDPAAARREAGGLYPVLPEANLKQKRKQKERPPASLEECVWKSWSASAA